MMFTADLYKQATGKTGLITVVTAFVPIPGHPRSEAEYHELGDRLLALDHVMFAQGGLDRCWLYKHLRKNYDPTEISYSVADNPQKNSLAYHIVMAQKTEWLMAASIVDPFATVFIWIDYGIFHIPGVTRSVIEDFLQRAENEQAIAIPGCWEKDEFEYDDQRPCWRFCGGVMVVPRKYVEPFDIAMKHEYARWIELNRNVSWEVNTLARLERHNPARLPFWWYRADHDKTIFTNYRATEFADGEQTKAGLRGLEARYC
jgi:hypothetical protein